MHIFVQSVSIVDSPVLSLKTIHVSIACQLLFRPAQAHPGIWYHSSPTHITFFRKHCVTSISYIVLHVDSSLLQFVFLQFVMGLLKLGFVAVYLSDPIISGFTTGAAILVFTSQVKHILGLSVPRYAGAFAVVKVCH